MHDATLRALEFDRVVEAARSFALTPLGAAALDALTPQTDPRQVRAALGATGEAAAFLESTGPFGLEAPPDLHETVEALAVEGRVLDPPQLTGMATFLASVDATRQALGEATGGPYPALRTIVEGVRSFDREVREIRATIDPQGDVIDTATPALRVIRERLRKQRHRLRSTLESYLRGRDTAKYLQEQVVTERAGRYVLVVRSEHRSAIPGIVHGSSGSGASLFLEPLSTVEINNDIVALEDDETAEVRRILLALANGLRKRALDLRHTLSAATELDVIQARGNLSRLLGGECPTLATDHRLELPHARHPLLVDAVRRRAGLEGDDGATRPDPVPVDIMLSPPTGALVITGPNTGGKTVALKTAGLLVAMTQAGLLIPAGPNAVIPVCRDIFADIGDEQSIANSLSTFSGHITNLVAMDRRLTLPALVLLDEVGAGTDPVEGGALGAAVIDHFRRRGALVLATTHDDMLKSYAATTDGVSCAGFGFDSDTYAPTYRLTYGTPGRSLALEIAGRLGMPDAVLDDARARRSAREAQLADHLAQVERDLADVAAQRDAAATARKALDQAKADMAAREGALDEREAEARRRTRTDLDESVRAARAEVHDIVDRVRREAAQLVERAAAPVADRPVSTGDGGALKRRALEALETARQRTGADTGEAPPAPEPATTPGATPTPGCRVRVDSLRLDGTVTAIHGRDAEVEARGKRLHVRLTDLRVLDAPIRRAGGGVTVDVATNDAPPLELNVVGCRVDDALARVEKYLDQALLHERRQLRVIHGHGTGQLRRAIAGFLDEHPLVAKFALAAPEHGGGGVTEIELKS